jgi:hypothetical protein
LQFEASTYELEIMDPRALVAKILFILLLVFSNIDNRKKSLEFAVNETYDNRKW